MASSSKKAARERVEELRKEQRRKERRRTVAIYGSMVAALLVIAGVVTFAIVRDVQGRPTLDAVKSYKVSQGHVTTPVSYEVAPPAGGEHDPVWLNCGTYTEPVRNENAVHSMEHGAVWVTYKSDLPKADVEKLTAAMPDTYAVLSPVADLKAPVVASAWGKQVELSGASDPRLEAFIKEYRLGPQTPEPGAACTGGTDGKTGGTPMDAPQ
jgi:hypothetical protein